MKILLLSYDFKPNLGGVATVAHEVAHSLQTDFGHEVTVLSIGKTNETDDHSSYKIIRYQSPRSSLVSIIFCLLQILKLRRQTDFDIAIGMLWIPDGICLYLSNFFAKRRLPYLIYAHGVEILETKSTVTKRIRSFLSPLKKLVLTRAEAIICVSNYTKEQVEKHTSATNACVINNGVNPKLFNHHNPVSITPFTFVSVARLEDYKGIDFCLRACAELMRQEISFHYKIVGDGPDSLRLKEMCRDLKLEKNVEFLGILGQAEIAQVLSSSSCFLLLPRLDLDKPNIEGFGLVFLEAAASGIPSVAGNSGGVPDAVLDYDTGLLVNPTNIQEIVASMKKIMEDKELYLKLKNRALDRARNELTWKNQVKKLNEVVIKYVRN
jgi:phosphatidyl-myo-inositol dimannoside synthase